MDKNDSEFILRWAKKIKAVELLGGKCVNCGNDNLFLLTFHHPNDDKEHTVSTLMCHRWSVIEKEISKCELLCGNCHIMHHFNNGRISREKKILFQKMGFDRCSKCGYTNEFLVALCLHHYKGEKNFALRDYFKNKGLVPVIELMEEIDKCKVLCENCHRMEHIDVERFGKFEHLIKDKVFNYVEQHIVDHEKIFDLKSKGYGTCKIASELGVAKSTVSTILNKK